MFQLNHMTTRGVAAAALLSALVLSAPLRAATTDTQVAQATTAPAAPAKPSRADRVEARVTKLHDQLKITATQEPQWNAVAQVMRDNENTMRAAIEQRRQNAATMTAVDDLRSYQAITEAHAQGLQKLVPAFQALYETMSDDQKKNADKIFSHGPRHHHHGRHGAAQ